MDSIIKYLLITSFIILLSACTAGNREIYDAIIIPLGSHDIPSLNDISADIDIPTPPIICGEVIDPNKTYSFNTYTPETSCGEKYDIPSYTNK